MGMIQLTVMVEERGWDEENGATRRNRVGAHRRDHDDSREFSDQPALSIKVGKTFGTCLCCTSKSTAAAVKTRHLGWRIVGVLASADAKTGAPIGILISSTV